MKPRLLITLAAFLLLMASPAWAERSFDFQITGERSAEQAAYLGAPEQGPFTLADVDSDYVIIQIFSMYCPFCQAEAPHMAAFFDLLKQSPLTGKLKLLAIGAGNSQYEVDYFRDKYGLTFPIFSDGDYVIHKHIGEVGTPYYFLIKRDGLKVVHEQQGRFETPEAFLKMLQDAIAKE